MACNCEAKSSYRKMPYKWYTPRLSGRRNVARRVTRFNRPRYWTSFRRGSYVPYSRYRSNIRRRAYVAVNRNKRKMVWTPTSSGMTSRALSRTSSASSMKGVTKLPYAYYPPFYIGQGPVPSAKLYAEGKRTPTPRKIKSENVSPMQGLEKTGIERNLKFSPRVPAFKRAAPSPEQVLSRDLNKVMSGNA